MTLPAVNPALPSSPNPYFQDNAFVRGDQQRANNGFIWDNFDYLDADLVDVRNRVTILEGRLPAGVILSYAGFTVPTRTLICNGAAVSRATYADLFSQIVPNRGAATISIAAPGLVTQSTHGLTTGESLFFTTTGALPTGLSANTLYFAVVNDTNTFWLATTFANALANVRITTTGSQSGVHTLFICPWGLGDGSLTFNLPDLRGAYLRGDGTSTLFTQNGTFPFGATYSDQFQGHWHQFTSGGQTIRLISNQVIAGSTYAAGNGVEYPQTATHNPVSDGTNGTTRTGTETRPNTRIVKYAITF